MTAPTDVQIQSHGQQLLAASRYAPTEIAKLVGVRRQRVHEWTRGVCRPDTAARQAISKALGIPPASWDAAPVRQMPGIANGTQAAVDAGPDAPAAVAALTDDQLAELGEAGIAGVIGRLRAMQATLPPRERVAACTAEGRLHDRLVAIRARDADARRDYFASADFRQDVTLLAGAIRSDAASLRTALGRLGVELPIAEVDQDVVDVSPPTTPEDVHDLVRELEAARDFVVAGEPHLAAGHLSGLCLDLHADALAKVLAEHNDLAARVLDLLPEDGPDRRFVAGALERRMALRDVAQLPEDARRVVGSLLELLGHPDTARDIGGSDHG